MQMSNNIHVFFLLLIPGFSSISADLRAQDAEPLETLVVSGTRTAQDRIVTPSSIRIITAEDIHTSGASHIVEVLRNQGGIQVSDLYGDGSRTTISMRGFGGNAQANTLILVDGRRLNNTDLGTPDLNSVSLKDVERIEIVRGSSGVLYGDQAVGGIINIITRRPDELSVDVTARYGSYDKRAGDVHVSNRHDNGIGYRFSGERSKTDNYRDNNEQDYTNLLGLLDFEHQYGSVFLEYQDVREELETPGTLFSDQVRTNRRQAFNPDDQMETDTRNFRAGFVQKLWAGWNLLAEYTDHRADSDGILSFGGVPGPFVTNRDHREFTPRLSGEIAMPNGTALVTLGADFFNSDFFLDSILGSIENEQKQMAVYGQGVVPLTNTISLTIGGRHAKVENDITGALLPPNTEIDDDVNAIEAGISYRPDDHWRLFSRFDANYRYVLADEYTSASFGGVIPDTQTGRSWEFGFDWMQEDADFNFVFYRLSIEDEIDFDPILFINTNIGDTERLGFIMDGSYSPVERLWLGVNYSFVSTEIDDGPLAGLEIPFVAKHTVKFTGGYQFTPDLLGQLELLGISERVATGDFFNLNRALPGYFVSNLNLAYTYGPVRLGFRVNNLFDREYSDNAQLGFLAPLFIPETTYFTAPERNYLLTLSYTFN